MRFVISVWNEFANDIEFEDVIPLEFNGHRLAQLGERNRIDVLVLEGYERFSDGYLGRLRELGYTVHDARALAQEHAARMPLFIKKYRGWGGIKHYGILRFLVIPRSTSSDDRPASGPSPQNPVSSRPSSSTCCAPTPTPRVMRAM
jgi:hypothetical protein